MNKNVASQKVTFLVIDISTNAPKTGDAANLTAYVSIDDGAVTVLGDTSATELDATNAPGLYSFDLTQGETNGDKLLFSGKSSTANIRVIPLLLYTVPSGFSAFVTPTGATGVVLSAAGVQAIWDALSAALTTANSIGKRLVDNLTGDIYARIGAPAGASVSADIAAVKVDTAAILVDTGTTLDGRIPAALVGGKMESNIGSVTAGVIAAASFAANALDAVWSTAVRVLTAATNITSTGGTTVPQTGDSYARLGAPAGASVSADIAALPTATENADEALVRDWTAVAAPADRSTLNALRFLRNKWAIAAGTLTVNEEDDATPAWTGAVTTTAGDPVSEIDPA